MTTHRMIAFYTSGQLDAFLGRTNKIEIVNKSLEVNGTFEKIEKLESIKVILTKRDITFDHSADGQRFKHLIMQI